MISPYAGPTLSVYLPYKDVNAAIAWLSEVFGFESGAVLADEAGIVGHAEVRIGNAIVVLYQNTAGYEPQPVKEGSTGYGILLTLADREEVDRVYKNAVSKGGVILFKASETPWGNYRCVLLDLEGHEWAVSIMPPGFFSDWHKHQSG